MDEIPAENHDEIQPEKLDEIQKDQHQPDKEAEKNQQAVIEAVVPSEGQDISIIDKAEKPADSVQNKNIQLLKSAGSYRRSSGEQFEEAKYGETTWSCADCYSNGDSKFTLCVLIGKKKKKNNNVDGEYDYAIVIEEIEGTQFIHYLNENGLIKHFTTIIGNNLPLAHHPEPLKTCLMAETICSNYEMKEIRSKAAANAYDFVPSDNGKRKAETHDVDKDQSDGEEPDEQPVVLQERKRAKRKTVKKQAPTVSNKQKRQLRSNSSIPKSPDSSLNHDDDDSDDNTDRADASVVVVAQDSINLQLMESMKAMQQQLAAIQATMSTPTVQAPKASISELYADDKPIQKKKKMDESDEPNLLKLMSPPSSSSGRERRNDLLLLWHLNNSG